MKTLLAGIAIAIAPAIAGADGFFRPMEEGVFNPVARAPRDLPKIGGFSCALQVRYNSAHPTLIELTYVGGGFCVQWYEPAILQVSALPAAKVSVPGEPAIPPVYECSVNVNFNPGGVPSLVNSGAGVCEITRPTALRAARQGVLCQFHPVPCNL